MPKASHHQAVARQWEILKRLPSRGPGLTARHLADVLAQHGFVVTKRTIERDLLELSSLFPLVCNDKGTPYGWHWMEGKGVDLPGPTVAEALSLHLVEDLLRPLLPAAILDGLAPRFRQAAAKLAVLGQENSSARWADKVRHVPPALPLHPPDIAPGVLEAVHTALLNDRQLEASYRSAGRDGPHSIRLHPLGLVQRGPLSYLVASAFSYEDVRLYAVHRIQAATITEDACRRPNGFDLNEYVASGALQFASGAALRLEARVSEELAAILAETPLSNDQLIAGNTARPMLTATVADSWQLRWWLLSQGSSIEVVNPIWMREEIGNELSDAARLYRMQQAQAAGAPENNGITNIQINNTQGKQDD